MPTSAHKTFSIFYEGFSQKFGILLFCLVLFFFVVVFYDEAWLGNKFQHRIDETAIQTYKENRRFWVPPAGDGETAPKGTFSHQSTRCKKWCGWGPPEDDGKTGSKGAFLHQSTGYSELSNWTALEAGCGRVT